MNKVIISGNISTDIEFKTTPNGVPVAKFNVAVRRIKDETDFLPVVAWNQQAENVNEFCEKGSKVLIDGRIQVRDYEKDSEKRRVTEIVAERVEFLSQNKKTSSEAKKYQKDPYSLFADNIKTESQIGEQIEIDEDDMPF